MTDRIIEILGLIERDEELINAITLCDGSKRHLNITGLCEQQKGYMVSAMANRSKKKPVIICSDAARARLLAGFIKPFVEGEVVTITPREMSLVNALASSKDPEIERLGAICKLYNEDYGAAIICAGSLLNKMPSTKMFVAFSKTIKYGESLDPADLAQFLVEAGYERVNLVAAQGEFSWRGDIVDVYPPDCSNPIRISFFDDEVDQIKYFELETQRSVETIKRVTVMPAREIIIPSKQRLDIARQINQEGTKNANHLKHHGNAGAGNNLISTAERDADMIRGGIRVAGIEKWISIIYPEPSTILEYINLNHVELFADEFAEIRSRIDAYTAEYVSRVKTAAELGAVGKIAFESIMPIPETMKALDKISALRTISCLNSSGNGLPGGKTVICDGLACDSYRGQETVLASLLKENMLLIEGEKKAKNVKKFSKTICIMGTGKQRTANLVAALVGEGATLEVIEETLPSGFVYPAIRLQLIGEQDVFGADKIIKKKRKNGSPISFFTDLTPGDYVVHDAHGIGCYEGLVNMKVGDTYQDYLKITYAKGATLYITMDNLDSIQKYIGPNGKSPKLSNLDSQEWKKSVEKAKTSIKKVAFDLVKLYAARRANKGFACGPDTVWQKEFEENFPYVETEDQLRAIEDIKRDMESETPMDRLLCGDVGFGKTEVAFRAIYKCVHNGKQAFMLSPTTLLAHQHYENFLKRLGDDAINVKLLSRFVTAKEMRDTLKGIKDGSVDVVIGTHRILSKDVVPHDLGLLVVDEEQRFGVNHKEQIKAMRNNIDILTLTATPIPRTLHMSISGIRDISVLDEAPMNRRPVQTYVMGYDEEVIVQACMREIGRHGQIFYLYNKTIDIDKKAQQLANLMPGVRVSYAHGKMSESQMENIINSFVNGEADILVCTTIIESGVDMPNVNTMIVEDGDKFGLSQLYQIKGRVGRSDKQAYAYITYNEDKEINSDAKKRLMAIREFTELGSGIKIAMRDLEVRGAGNLLGAEQHGQMDVIGYELYCRLLDEEIKNLRSNPEAILAEHRTSTIEMTADFYIPSSYIEDEATRMLVYRRISSISTRTEYEDFLDEVIDRYGDPPSQVITLANVSLARALAQVAGFEKISIVADKVLFHYFKIEDIDMKAITEVIGYDEFKDKILLNAAGKPYLHYIPMGVPKNKVLEKTVDILSILVNSKTGA